MQSSNFLFAELPEEYIASQDGHSALVKIAGLKDKHSIIVEYHDKLELPDYLGFGWDSLDEVLQDTDWMKSDKVIVAHDGIPGRLSGEDVKILLEILRDTVLEHQKDLEMGDWLRKKKVEFVVVFPNNVKEEIENILKQDEEESKIGLTSRKA